MTEGMETQSAVEKKPRNSRRLVILIGIAVVVVAAAIGGGLWWNSQQGSAQVDEAVVAKAEQAAEVGVGEVASLQAAAEAKAPVQPAAEQAEAAPQAEAPVAEPVEENSMAVVYEDENFILSVPADKAEHTSLLGSQNLDSHTEQFTFNYSPPGENNGSGLVITATPVDCSSATDDFFKVLIGRNSLGVYIYAMEAGGGFLDDAYLGAIITLK